MNLLPQHVIGSHPDQPQTGRSPRSHAGGYIRHMPALQGTEIYWDSRGEAGLLVRITAPPGQAKLSLQGGKWPERKADPWWWLCPQQMPPIIFQSTKQFLHSDPSKGVPWTFGLHTFSLSTSTRSVKEAGPGSLSKVLFIYSSHCYNCQGQCFSLV